MSEATEEQRWIELAAGGDEQALGRLVTAYQRRIAGFVFGMTGESWAVEDLVQVTFVKAARALPRLRERDQFERWLFQIARNACLSHLRKRKWTRLFEPLTEALYQIPADAAPASPRDWEELHTALEQLPEGQRELLCLLRQGDYSYGELAQITGSSVASVRSRLQRAREHLRRWLHHE